ncbi:TerD family protein [Kovacikia minuta CCNUW1]|uniref:TerD family protein n=1 Tax=Kovacikia minuta TaxID=2931930 RepID=UPI001CCB6828|nr:TerD family protein [Kovacikia minuta]UBF24749.1 TerD family protein [Kovacikia minuta CCNUW1]
MTQSLAISEWIESLAEAESQFNLRPADNDQFFSEWYGNLPELTETEQARLDLIKQRYLYHQRYGPLAEGTINFIVMSPLLELAGFYDPPFRFRSEASVKVEVENQNKIYRGRIDGLVLQNTFWIILIESKETSFNISVAVPQALAYMMGNPYPDRPGFGLVSNGSHFMFLKLVNQGEARYALSDDFSLYRRQNELYPVLSVLKRIQEQV